MCNCVLTLDSVFDCLSVRSYSDSCNPTLDRGFVPHDASGRSFENPEITTVLAVDKMPQAQLLERQWLL
jgi:hypothetical protein